jgi:hypothetical protein
MGSLQNSVKRVEIAVNVSDRNNALRCRGGRDREKEAKNQDRERSASVKARSINERSASAKAGSINEGRAVNLH